MKYPKIATLIENQRSHINKTIYEVAKRSDVSHTYISQIENGKRLPSNKVLFRIAFALSDEDDDIEFFEKLLKAYAEYKEISFEKLWSDFIKLSEEMKRQSDEFINEFFDSLIHLKVSVTKNTEEVKPLEEPYFDLNWILNQDKYEIFYGHTPIQKKQNNLDSSSTTPNIKNLLRSRLNKEDIYIIREIIEAYISNRYDKSYARREQAVEAVEKLTDEEIDLMIENSNKKRIMTKANKKEGE